MHVHLIISRESRANGVSKQDWLAAFTGVDFREEGYEQSAYLMLRGEHARMDFQRLGDRTRDRFPEGRYRGLVEQLGRGSPGVLGTCDIEVAGDSGDCGECRYRAVYEVSLDAPAEEA